MRVTIMIESMYFHHPNFAEPVTYDEITCYDIKACNRNRHLYKLPHHHHWHYASASVRTTDFHCIIWK